MWVYYALMIVSVMLFGGNFALKNVYREKRGSSLKISMESTFIGALAGLAVLFFINGFKFEFTPFTLLMASWASINGMAFAFCAFKALDYINLSLFSLFTMLGGMILPFFQGILFYNEGFSIAKGVCVIFVIASLYFTVQKDKKKSGTLFYIGVFILNGMSGVITKIFTSTNLPKASAGGYSICIAITTVILSGVFWLLLSVFEKRKKENNFKTERKNLCISYVIGASCGVMEKVGNYLLVIALAYVDASVQYPIITGGTIIASTLISFFGKRKPNKKEVISVLLAFAGMLLLFIIPV